MHYLITGGTGFIGTALIETLLRDGSSVTVLTRQSRQGRGPLNFVTSLDTVPADTRVDAVVNLAGASLAGARWSAAYKREIVSSRLATTEQLVGFLRRLEQPPEVLLSASAIGYYGHHGDEVLSEEGAVVPGFSSDLCRRWEAAAMEASDIGTRVCLLRFGVVLDSNGGAMAEMTKSFQLGVGSWIGSGRQWLSWVHRRDAIAAIQFLQQHPELAGPFNITAPEPVTSRGFCAAVQRHKRTVLSAPVPAPVIRLLVGEMADELLLNGQRVVPAGLQAAGFRFALPTIEAALAEIFSA
jgi:uncharacterized protein (TIGR01777 family)